MLVDIKDFDKEVSRLWGKDMIKDAREVLKNLTHYPDVGDTVYIIDEKLKIHKSNVCIISFDDSVAPPLIYAQNGQEEFLGDMIFMTREEAIERKNEILKTLHRKGDAC